MAGPVWNQPMQSRSSPPPASFFPAFLCPRTRPGMVRAWRVLGWPGSALTDPPRRNYTTTRPRTGRPGQVDFGAPIPETAPTVTRTAACVRVRGPLEALGRQSPRPHRIFLDFSSRAAEMMKAPPRPCVAAGRPKQPGSVIDRQCFSRYFGEVHEVHVEVGGTGTATAMHYPYGLRYQNVAPGGVREK